MHDKTRLSRISKIFHFLAQQWLLDLPPFQAIEKGYIIATHQISIRNPSGNHLSKLNHIKNMLRQTSSVIIAVLLTTAPLISASETIPQETPQVQSENQSLNPRYYSPWSPAVLVQDSSGICPQWAYINCQSISGPNYCCGSGTYCAYGGPANHIGCCADSGICSGEPAAVTATVNCPIATATTWWTRKCSSLFPLVK
jgi:hypothetical protein